MNLLEEAEKIYKENFPMETCFERAVFFSWGCNIGDCTFCFMSTQPEDKRPPETRRTNESILAEFVLAKELGWDIGFFSGGIGVYSPDEMELMLKRINEITGEKIWLNIGPVSKALLARYAPYLKGIVSSIETINPELHKKVCPSKPMKPYEVMFENSRELGLERGMTFICGMGEVESDFELLVDFIRKYGITKIHFYGLIPHEGTEMESFKAPTKEWQAWWIAKLRIEFPKLDIQCGIWHDRIDYVSYLLKAGANSMSKFKATKLFGTQIAADIEKQAELAGRKFVGTLTEIPDVDWDGIIDGYSFDERLKEGIKEKLHIYLDKMRKNCQERTS